MIDARHDTGERRLVAELGAPGGYRLASGSVPVPAAAEDDTDERGWLSR